MKKFLLPALVTLMLAGGASAEVNVTVTPLGERPTNTARKVVSTADILVRQDFSDLTVPYIVGPISSAEFPQEETNTRIDNLVTGAIPAELMGGQEGWSGEFIYSDDGAAVIQTYGAGAQYPCWLNTPPNDYSGTLTISFIAKAIPTYWYSYNNEGEVVTKRYTGSSIQVRLFDPQNRPIEAEGNTSYSLADVRMYPDQGWCEVKIEVDNFSAYNDVCVGFGTADIVKIDDIKITSSADNFIAPPVIKSVTDVTDTSFTVNIEPVRKAFNYYVYLYTLDGYDDNGEPVFLPVWSPQQKATAEFYAEYFGMTIEEYWQEYLEEWDINDPYQGYEYFEGTSFTFTELDPEVQYYYAVRSHFVTKFSDLVIYEQTILPTPITQAPSEIGPDSFTALWKPVTKATDYFTYLYGVNVVEENESDYYLMDDEFNKGNSLTTGTIQSPDELDPEDPTALDPYTNIPGWQVVDGMPLVAEDHIGVVAYYGGIISPDLYLKGADTITVNARIISDNPYCAFYLTGAGTMELCYCEDGVWEDELTYPTNGKEWDNIQLLDIDGSEIFIDYMIVSRNVNKGEYIYTYQQSAYTDGQNSYVFENLDTDRFPIYAYSVMALQEVNDNVRTSAVSEMQIVDLTTGGSWTGIDELTNSIITPGTDVEIEAIYTPDGQPMKELVKGLNIIRFNDGSTKKVMVK